MNGTVIIRFIICLVVVTILAVMILPRVGVPQSRYLPPSWVYGTAQGKAQGWVTGKHTTATANPFNVGGEFFFIDYKFAAVPPDTQPAATGKTAYKQTYQWYSGSVLCDGMTYKGVGPGQTLSVQYEMTYPDVNGVYKYLDNYMGADTVEDLGRGCLGASNNYSGWLMWIAGDVLVAIVLSIIWGGVSPKHA